MTPERLEEIKEYFEQDFFPIATNFYAKDLIAEIERLQQVLDYRGTVEALARLQAKEESPDWITRFGRWLFNLGGKEG